MKVNLKSNYRGFMALILGVIVVFSIGVLLRLWIFSPDNDTLYIAVVGPISGKDKSDGEEMTRGINLCLDQINKEGGINGKRIELLVFDDQNDEELAQNKALEITEQNKALVVLGHDFSSTSIKGGEIYKDAGIPAISGSATAESVTEGNDWYFRVIFNNRSQAACSANYVKTALNQETASIIYSQDSYGKTLAEAFESTFRRLEGKIKYIWSFDTMAEDLDERLEQIITDLLKVKTDIPGMIFMATHSSEAVKIITSLRRNGIKNPIIGGDALSDYSFVVRFNEYPEERAIPGYFSDGIYATSPIIFDVASRKSQRFINDFVERYGKEPNGMAAMYYDATLVAVEAIRKTGVQGKSENLAAERKKIREYLAASNSIEKAVVEGITGHIYFDKQGNVVKPVVIGVFAKQHFISTLTQFQPVSDLKRIDDLNKEIEAGRVFIVEGKHLYKTNVVYTGIEINEISDLDRKDWSYTMEFYLWFRFQDQFDTENIEFLNAAEPIQLSSPIEEHVNAHLIYRLYKVRGRFKADFLPDIYAFDQHVLGVSFRHATLPRQNLIYVTDVLGIQQPGRDSSLNRHKTTQQLNSISGWRIHRKDFFQDISEKPSLGRPDYLDLPKQTITYSLFNAGIWIKKNEFSLQGMISTLKEIVPGEIVNFMLITSSIITVFLAYAGKGKRLSRYPKSLWCAQAFFAILLLLSVQIALIGWLMGKISMYHLKLFMIAFDILWWGISAFLLNMAVKRFLWIPLETRSGRMTPRVVRRFAAFMIYLLTFFGIVAFVFDQTITSLVATSGMFAVLIGFASKVDISNVFAGIGISLAQPFRIGDWVKIGNFNEGQVVDMTSRATKLQSRDYSMLSIPNTMVSGSAIENYNYPDDRYRIQFTLETVPKHQPERVQKILLDAVFSTEGVLTDPEPMILFDGQGKSCIIYTIVVYVRDYGKKHLYKQSVWKHIWTHLEYAGIELATLGAPRRDPLMAEVTKEKLTAPLSLLRQIEIFHPLSDEAKTSLGERVRYHHFAPGETIIWQHDTGDSMFIIIEGAVGVWLQFNGGTSVELARLGTGDFFGEMSILTDSTRTASIVSMTETSLFEIMKEDLVHILEEHPEMSKRLSDVLAVRVRDIESQKALHHAQKTEKESLFTKISRGIRNFLRPGKVVRQP